MNNYLNTLFNLEDKVAVVIGAGGHICSEMAMGYARAGCKVAVLDLRLEKAVIIRDNIIKEGSYSDTYFPGLYEALENNNNHEGSLQKLYYIFNENQKD